jgi:hypothetical protein
LHPATRRWLDSHAPAAELVELPATDAKGSSGYSEDLPECAYWRLIRDLWVSGDDFMLVEQDMQPHADSVRVFAECTAGWCVFPYPGEQPIWTSRRHAEPPRATRVFRCALGCTRFRAEFTAKHPLAVEHMRHKHWRRVDSQLASFLFQHGEKACEHEPQVVHHHDYSKENT